MNYFGVSMVSKLFSLLLEAKIMMYWNYTLKELLVTVLLLCLAPNHVCQDVSNNWAIGPGEYPFLVLVEIPSYSGGPVQHVSGVLTSLSCVLVLSNELAQLPSGRSSPVLHLRVYAGIIEINQLDSSSYRNVTKITNLLPGKDNKYFPNLVLLKLETPFQGNSMIRPVVFNVGMLSPRSTVVGWAHSPGSNITLTYAVAVRVIPRTSTRCNHWRLVEFPEQMCCYDLEPLPITLSEGALLVDQNYLTAIKQFDTYLQSPLSTTIALFVRIGHFMTWIQDVVLDPVPSTVFLKTKFDDDDINLEPVNDGSIIGSTVKHGSFWNHFQLAVVVLAVFNQWP